MVYQNSRKSTVTTKQLDAQGAEETKHELKASMWGKPVTEILSISGQIRT